MPRSEKDLFHVKPKYCLLKSGGLTVEPLLVSTSLQRPDFFLSGSCVQFWLTSQQRPPSPHQQRPLKLVPNYENNLSAAASYPMSDEGCKKLTCSVPLIFGLYLTNKRKGEQLFHFFWNDTATKKRKTACLL